jgi:uncharacterized protein (DUF362 family)
MKPFRSLRRHRGWIAENHQANRGRNKLVRFLFPLTGLVSLIWLLIRIIPKPSRAQYPCMKAAAPIAGGFLAYIVALAVAAFSFKKAGHYFRKSKHLLASVLVLLGFAAGLFTVLKTETGSYAHSVAADSLFVPIDSPNSPMGTAKGIFPGRVVWMWDSSATSWNGRTGNWWDDQYTNPVVADSMLSKSLRALTGTSSDKEAWDALFKYFNERHGKGAVGYQPGEKIAVKINLVQSSNPSSFGGIGNACFVPPQVAVALLRQLVDVVGVKDGHITIYDTDRYVPDPVYAKCKNAYPGVHFMGWVNSNGREKYVRDTTQIHWSEKLTMEINGGHPAYLPTTVTQAAYLINLADFKAHRYMGVTFCSKNHFGTLSADGNDGKEYQNAPHAAGIHFYSAVHDIFIQGSPEWTFKGRPMGSYNTIVDLMGHKDLGAKTLLYMVEALYGVPYEGCPVGSSSKWLSAPFNNDWTSSLFLSQDNVAIESVCLDFFRTEQAVNPNYTNTYGSVDNYLHEAAQADKPPSGTVYCPSGDGVRLQSLGVHEHWNNSTDKQYSRNLKTGTGIELFRPRTSASSVAIGETVPSGFALMQNYPNPFNPSTTIGYRLTARSLIAIKVYSALGREVATLVNEEKPAGMYHVLFDAKSLPSGVYFYCVQVYPLSGKGNSLFSETKKLIVVR